MGKIGITETVLTSAEKSMLPGQMPLYDFERILETMDTVGYHSIECWGGAVFDSCLRHLGEDPWERLRAIRARILRTPLQMTLRGQSLFGFKLLPDDVVRAFVRRAVECGIGVVRVFDVLNDLRNIETAADEALRAGAHVSGALCYAESPAHSLDTFMALGKRLEQMGCHSVCIKDSAGLMGPKVSHSLVRALKQSVRVPVVVHTLGAAGLDTLSAMKAVEAGADVIDCTSACLSGGTSPPATEAMNHALGQMGFDAKLDTAALKKVGEFFLLLRRRAIDGGALCAGEPVPEMLEYRVPAGMLDVFVSAGESLRLSEALEEAVAVRRELGWPPLETPVSQIIAAQAVSNMRGGRYAHITGETRALLAGEYGKPPAEVDRELRYRALDGRAGVAGRPAALLEPGLEKARAEIAHLARSEDDVLSYAAFPQVAELFMEKRAEGRARAFRYTFEEV